MLCLGRLGHLDQDAVTRTRVQERDGTRQALPARLVDHREVRRLDPGEGRRHVPRLHAQVMDPLAFLFQEPRDAPGRIRRLQ
jgi:hypothetical protein